MKRRFAEWLARRGFLAGYTAAMVTVVFVLMLLQMAGVVR